MIDDEFAYDTEPARCDFCGMTIPDDTTFWEAEGKTYCADCLPKEAQPIGERH